MSSRPHKKENVLNLEKYLDKAVHVKFHGGRECSGILKGCDPLMNLVPELFLIKKSHLTSKVKIFLQAILFDQSSELLTDLDDPYKLTGEKRQLGLVVCRGTSINMVCPKEGMEVIENPFL